MSMLHTRRDVLAALLSAGAAGRAGVPRAVAAEEPPETRSVHFIKNPAICVAPQAAAEDLFRAEGFTEIGYVEVKTADAMPEAIANGRADFTLAFGANHIQAIDHDAPITILAGVHVGCYELFARNGIGSIGELRGKSIGLKAGSPTLLRLIAAWVGLDPDMDIRWVTDPRLKPLDLFAQGKIDAFLAFPPEPQELRARHAGHVILSTAMDRPWSQYFCCMLAGNREFVRSKPVATKRVLRAMLKAADLCATQPRRVARRIVEGGFAPRYDYALQTLGDVPYDKWREYDAEDTIRFYALRLHEIGMIRSSPRKIIADGTDFRSFNELKRELKA